jgi:uncharacterized protein
MAEISKSITEQTARPRALVTGASAGLGQAFAERLAKDGYNLALVARRRERLEMLADRLRQREGVHVDVLAADLTQSDELRSVEEYIANDDTMAMLVNNAGFAGYMPFLQLAPERAEELIGVHVTAPVRLTRAVLPGMVSRQRGAIVNVSSLLAFSAGLPAAAPLPKRATYGSCKAFLNIFTELLQTELEGTGVRVQALCPGVIEPTEFQELAGLDPSQIPPNSSLTPQAVVEASLAGLHRGEVICLPSVEDPALLTRGLDETGRTTYPRGPFAGAIRGSLAQRYLESQSAGD